MIASNTVAHVLDEDLAYAVATVSIFGSLSVLLYPIDGHLLQMTAETYGLWAGTPIHEIGQVAVAADAGPASSDAAMIASCRASCLLAPTVLLLAALAGLRLDLDPRQLRTRSWRPFLLGALSTIFVCGLSLTAILLWKP